jgi:Protein of unknown function (DUF559)
LGKRNEANALSKRLIIELDGGHNNEDETAKRDRERQLWLEKEGYRVVRFWNSEITNDLTAVLELVYVELYGSREADVGPLKHRRYLRKLHPTPPAPDDAAHRRDAGDPPPSRGG